MNSGQPGAPIMQAPTESSGYPLLGHYSQPQGGYSQLQQQPSINATAPGTVYTITEGNWMPVPVGVPICPPGLEYLTVIDQLIFHQKGLEFFQFLPKNQFSIKNNFGQKIYSAEELDWSMQNLCSFVFDMNIKDKFGKDVIQLNTRSQSCQMLMEVMSPPGMLIGSVVREFTFFSTQFSVLDASGEIVLIIKGQYQFCSDMQFKILSRDGTAEVGSIRKLYYGFSKAFTDADKLDITFPMDLDVNIKAVLLGACMLILEIKEEDEDGFIVVVLHLPAAIVKCFLYSFSGPPTSTPMLYGCMNNQFKFCLTIP